VIHPSIRELFLGLGRHPAFQEALQRLRATQPGSPVALSGLTLTQMRHCWQSRPVSSLLEGKSTDPLSRVLRFDPHKAVIQVNNGVLNDIVTEIISGR